MLSVEAATLFVAFVILIFITQPNISNMIRSRNHTFGKQLYVSSGFKICLVCLGQLWLLEQRFVSKKILFDKKDFVSDGQLWLVKQPVSSVMDSYGG